MCERTCILQNELFYSLAGIANEYKYYKFSSEKRESEKENIIPFFHGLSFGEDII